jgi:hypothetical protein
MKLDSQMSDAYYKMSMDDPLVRQLIHRPVYQKDCIIPNLELDEYKLAATFLMVYRELLVYREAALKIAQLRPALTPVEFGKIVNMHKVQGDREPR